MNTTAEKTIKKVVNPLRFLNYTPAGGAAEVFAKITYREGKLSISGVVGPRKNGDCYGSCDQIEMSIEEELKRYPHEFCAGWDAALFNKFIGVWRAWHLNDMCAGCEHQRRAPGYGKEDLEVVSYGLTTEAYRLREDAIDRAAKAQAQGISASLNETERALVLLDDWSKKRFAPPDADSPLSGCYEVKKREVKKSGWVTKEEHPRGCLLSACGECGYKYGSAWLKEEVPADVLEFLSSLPGSGKVPAWV